MFKSSKAWFVEVMVTRVVVVVIVVIIVVVVDVVVVMVIVEFVFDVLVEMVVVAVVAGRGGSDGGGRDASQIFKPKIKITRQSPFQNIDFIFTRWSGVVGRSNISLDCPFKACMVSKLYFDPEG